MIDPLLHNFAARIVKLAHALLPPAAQDWGLAMQGEVAGLDRGPAALAFALGCLRAASAERLLALFDPNTAPSHSGVQAMNLPALIARHPFRTGLICAVTATGLGLAYLTMGQAPPSHLAINSLALILGLIAIQTVSLGSRGRDFDAGLATLLLGIALLVLGQMAPPLNGAARWVRLGGVTVQPSLVLVPLLTVCFAASRNAMAACGVALAAAALALQPDRAMAGALAGAAGVLAIVALSKHTASVFAIAAICFAFTLLRPDLQSAVPFVDQIYRTAFTVHPLAGAAVICGAAILMIPALGALQAAPQRREIHAAFGAVWLGIIAAAALGNYPTPVVGYSGSAVLGYTLSLLLFHPVISARLKSAAATPAEAEQPHRELRRAVA